MLMQRVLTAAVLLPLLLAAIIWLPPGGLYLVFCAAALAGAWEWTRLARMTQVPVRAGYVVLCALMLAASWMLRAHWPLLFALAALWWLFALVAMLRYPTGFSPERLPIPLLGLFGLLMLVPAVAALAALRAHDDGARWVLHVFFVIFCADTGAYFAGRAFGRHKLLVAVSPGKTIEGAVGGLLLALVWSAASGHWLLGLEPVAVGWLVAGGVLVVAASIIGDLTESLFKRAAGVKDSGTLLPGHGGVLDRVDSVLSAAPVMALWIAAVAL